MGFWGAFLPWFSRGKGGFGQQNPNFCREGDEGLPGFLHGEVLEWDGWAGGQSGEGVNPNFGDESKPLEVNPVFGDESNFWG